MDANKLVNTVTQACVIGTIGWGFTANSTISELSIKVQNIDGSLNKIIVSQDKTTDKLAEILKLHSDSIFELKMKNQIHQEYNKQVDANKANLSDFRYESVSMSLKSAKIEDLAKQVDLNKTKIIQLELKK